MRHITHLIVCFIIKFNRTVFLRIDFEFMLNA